MRRPWGRISFILLAVGFSCTPDRDDLPPLPCHLYDTGEEAGALHTCIEPPRDAVEVLTLDVEGDELVVSVSYEGGCAEHAWTLCWGGTLLESMPLRAELELGHDRGDESCDRTVLADVRFDVSPVRLGWEEAGGTELGPVAFVLDSHEVLAPW